MFHSPSVLLVPQTFDKGEIWTVGWPFANWDIFVFEEATIKLHTVWL